MAKPAKELAPQQARSRESLGRLLRAAQEVLGQKGLEGATIPVIAQHAGLTPGAVYRRFRDKDALLEAVILRMLERQDEGIRAALTPDKARKIPLTVFVEHLVRDMLASYRRQAGMIRAIRQFTQARLHTPFFRKAARLEVRTYQYLVDLFLEHREEIQHPEPKIAVSFAIMMLISTLVELVVAEGDLKLWKTLLPPDDTALRAELSRAFLTYLGVKPNSAGTQGS
ncbi:MAG TPA: helix-turn-helix domain-containing protein [Candidatus Acidoferrales bacterium]|nr:helix-turn-helix domain-containing protein [Candidatus Acidoferrales bacterium]